MVLTLCFTISHFSFLSTSHDMLDPTHLPIDQPYFDPPRMIRRVRKQLRNNTLRKLATGLILLEHNLHLSTGYYVAAQSTLPGCVRLCSVLLSALTGCIGCRTRSSVLCLRWGLSAEIIGVDSLVLGGLAVDIVV